MLTCCTGGPPPQRQSFGPSFIFRRAAAADIGGSGDDPGMFEIFKHFQVFLSLTNLKYVLPSKTMHFSENLCNFVVSSISLQSCKRRPCIPAAAAMGNAESGGSGSYNAAISLRRVYRVARRLRVVAVRSVDGSVARWQNLIPSFPWIAPGWRAWGRNPRKGRDQILQRSVAEP